ncbi:hypothetical protein RHA1_ro00796 [Rhodococcus jostii RHA1]|uniref:Uncharacterized protein n=1 Tax=Rhodococcus jostii (strain RHA1) TaxID=101510 RepID=Q0SIK5_RHOJR|nr:hypothetical protein RHA1_ro00796 [Rhodococcus jostii RHA1]
MDSARFGDVSLTYELREGGERVVLLHAGAFVSWYDPLVAQLMEYSTLRVIAAYRSGDKAAAVDGFLRHVCGDGYRAVLDRVIPHAFDEELDEADLFCRAEMPAVQQRSFGAGEARAHHAAGAQCARCRELRAVRRWKRARAALVPAGRAPHRAGGRAPTDGAKPDGIGAGPEGFLLAPSDRTPRSARGQLAATSIVVLVFGLR